MLSHQRSMSVHVNVVAKYWKMVEFGTLALLMVLKLTNPIFKIGMALHIGLQTMLVLFYSIIIYYKVNSLSHSDGSQSKGLIQKITDFVPNLIEKISTLVMKIILTVFKLNKIHQSKINLKRYSIVLTYSLIIFRKLLALMVSVYITAEDNESTHTKAIAIYSLFVSIQMKFINSYSNFDNTEKSNIHVGFPFFSCLKSLLSLNTSTKMNAHLLQITRGRLFIITNILVAIFLYYTFDNALESLDSDLIWNMLIRILILFDALYVNTFIIELSGLQLQFKNANDTIV
jgi:hypothetical protein